MKKIAIIGAGFTGLAAGLKLVGKGDQVVIFERSTTPGGLAGGFNRPNWTWGLEQHYHHWFTNDDSVLDLARRMNFPVIIKKPKTSIFIGGCIRQLDSPIQLLKFSVLKLIDRLRMALGLAFLKFNPLWRIYEGYTAFSTLPSLLGQRGFETVWEPQFKYKFGAFADRVSLVWFWARIRKRTASLAYPMGGFLKFAETMAARIKDAGGDIHFGCEVIEIKNGPSVSVRFRGATGEEKMDLFDRVIVTLPNMFFAKVSPGLPEEYAKRLVGREGLGAVNLILRLNQKFFEDETYWLSICEKDSPIMALVEHTNFIDAKNYGGEHVVYVANYVPAHDSLMGMSDIQLLEKYNSFLKGINPHYRDGLIGVEVFKTSFAQPLVTTDTAKNILSHETPWPHVFLANMEQVYPWDRGTNYAVEMGERVAALLL